jgi:hypothetical protein
VHERDEPLKAVRFKLQVAKGAKQQRMVLRSSGERKGAVQQRFVNTPELV